MNIQPGVEKKSYSVKILSTAFRKLTIDFKVKQAGAFQSEKGNSNNEMPKMCKQCF